MINTTSVVGWEWTTFPDHISSPQSGVVGNCCFLSFFFWLSVLRFRYSDNSFGIFKPYLSSFLVYFMSYMMLTMVRYYKTNEILFKLEGRSYLFLIEHKTILKWYCLLLVCLMVFNASHFQQYFRILFKLNTSQRKINMLRKQGVVNKKWTDIYYKLTPINHLFDNSS